MGVPLSVGSIDRCIREVGVACEPVATDLMDGIDHGFDMVRVNVR